VTKSGVKLHVKTLHTIEFVWKCPNPRCPKSKLDGAIRGTVQNWVILLAGQHLKGEAARTEKRRIQKEREQLLVAT
jgi:hypothetical protein